MLVISVLPLIMFELQWLGK